MKKLHLILGCLCSIASLCSLYGQSNMSVEKIWENGTHSAFTSIIEFEEKYYCSFREGETHIFNSQGEADGKVRIIASEDGQKWESVALFGKKGYDLRDPKLSITPDGRLMIIIGGSIYKNKELVGRVPQVCFSEDGVNYTKPKAVKLPKELNTKFDWLWRITWHDDTAYGVNYTITPDQQHASIALLKSSDGVHFEMVKQLMGKDFPNETTVRVMDDGEMLMMVRIEQGSRKAIWGRSKAPYTNWTWRVLDRPNGSAWGGPDFIEVDGVGIVLGHRTFVGEKMNKPQTLLQVGDRSGSFTKQIVLPSRGDTSYPGLMVVGDELWVSYYSQHDNEPPKGHYEHETTGIYLAKIPLSELR